MFAFQAGLKPVIAFCALAALSGLTGCASAGANSHSTQNAVAAPPTAVAQAVEVEDDGLPAQTPPLQRAEQQPDDPAEPYSPNYGGPSPIPRRAIDSDPAGKSPDQRPVIPADLPPDFRKQLVTALAQDE